MQNKIAIVGLGLIGGSLALALNKHFTVYGLDTNALFVKHAIHSGMISCGQVVCDSTDYNFIKGCSVVFIAVPIGNTLKVAQEIYAAVGDSVIITDVASVKSILCNAKGRIVGGHPMAGTEHNGVFAAVDGLFKDAWYCLTRYANTTDSDFNYIKDIAQNYLFSKTVELSYTMHDQVVAKVSHLPHVAAYCLSHTIVSPHTYIAGSGYVDTTRIASSSPQFWTDVLRLNKQNVINEISAYKAELDNIERLLINNDYNGICNHFSNAKINRDNVLAGKDSKKL